MVSFPNCKVNIGLRVLRKRPDGFHDISSIFVPVDFTDVLEIIPARAVKFESAGIEIPPGGTNSCLKAWELLHEDLDIPPVSIFLLKNIPTGAGLGGGSADGAFALKMLNEMFSLELSLEQLEKYALLIGSDCPFFIKNVPRVAEGRGEIFSELNDFETNPLSGKFILLIFPGIHVDTAWAYSQIKPGNPEKSIADGWKEPLENWRSIMVNDFEEPVFNRFTELKDIKRKLYEQGALYASMSGSGSTLFGIFNQICELNWTQRFKYVWKKLP